MDMIEKMASMIAAAEKLPESYRERGWQIMKKEHPEMADRFKAQARAALTALEQPTDEMVEAGDKALVVGDVGHVLVKKVFPAMIKAAKGD